MNRRFACLAGGLILAAPLAGQTSRSSFDTARLDSVVAYLRTQVDSAFPGAVVAVGNHNHIALLAAVGHYGVDDPRPMTTETLFDLASLTKVIGLTTACILLVDQKKLDLDAPVQYYLPEFRGTGKEKVTIRHLLTHSSGLPAWRPLFRETESREAALALVDTTPLDTVPGARYLYSDLGAIVLTQVVERITKTRIDQYLDTAVFKPLGMTTTRYLPPAEWQGRIAPTEMDTVFRHRMIRGEVHDENTGRLEGISGHAGLFSTGPDMATFAMWLLRSDAVGQSRATTGGDGPPAPARPRPTLPVVQEFTTRQDLPPGSSRALGWDTPSEHSSAGTKLSTHAFGHTGFTGTSIWLDPDRDLFIILLTNRVHPTRANTKILKVRPRVADLVVDALTDPRP
ncbi:MAG TPA: serine hydrolase domain-containing protein [Gemmatimonadales bacterium]